MDNDDWFLDPFKRKYAEEEFDILLRIISLRAEMTLKRIWGDYTTPVDDGSSRTERNT
jgi:hypothetical protein